MVPLIEGEDEDQKLMEKTKALILDILSFFFLFFLLFLTFKGRFFK